MSENERAVELDQEDYDLSDEDPGKDNNPSDEDSDSDDEDYDGPNYDSSDDDDGVDGNPIRNWTGPDIDERIEAEIVAEKIGDPAKDLEATKNLLKMMLTDYLPNRMCFRGAGCAKLHYKCRKTLRYAELYNLSLDRKNGFYALLFSKTEPIESVIEMAKRHGNMSQLIGLAIGCRSESLPIILDRELTEVERCTVITSRWDGKREYFIRELALRPPKEILCFHLLGDEYLEWSYPFIRHFGDLLWAQGNTKTLLELGHPASTDLLLGLMGTNSVKATDHEHYQALIAAGANPNDRRVVEKARRLALSWLLFPKDKRERLAAKYGVTIEEANTSYAKAKKKEPGPSKELWVGALLQGCLKYLNTKCKMNDAMLDARIEQAARIEPADSAFYQTVAKK